MRTCNNPLVLYDIPLPCFSSSLFEETGSCCVFPYDSHCKVLRHFSGHPDIAEICNKAGCDVAAIVCTLISFHTFRMIHCIVATQFSLMPFFR